MFGILSRMSLLLLRLNDFLLLPSGLNKTVQMAAHPVKYYSSSLKSCFGLVLLNKTELATKIFAE